MRNVEKDNTQVVEIRVYDMFERPVAELEGLTVRLLPLDKVAPTRAAADDVFYRVAWRKASEALSTKRIVLRQAG